MIKTISLLPLVLGLGLTLSGCDSINDAAGGAGDAVSSVASALDPSGWFGSDDTPTDTDTADNAENGVSADAAADTAPDLANLPTRPATTPAAQQQAAAQSLAADGAQARYSADTLRAGTEAAAAPPGAADMPPATQPPNTQLAMAAPSADAPPTADMTPPSAGPAAPPPSAQPAAPAATAAAVAPPPPAPMAAAAPPPAALTQGTAAVPVPGAVQAAALPPPAGAAASPAAPGMSAAPVGPSNSATPVGPSASGPVAARPAAAATPAAPRTVASARPPGAEPAVPPNTPVRGAATGSRFASDSELGFRQSEAPALNPSINQWVSAPVVARYRQTATNTGVAPVRLAAVPPKGGASETAGGAVSADFGPVTTASASIASMNGGVVPAAVVYFPGDGTALSKAARDQIRTAAEQFKAAGAGGSIRVVGHASSRTPNMTVEKHLETIFKKSQDRANAVAQELIHQGVPAAKVLIDAVGDSQPVYYESMPQGEEGNRRAEIFVQS